MKNFAKILALLLALVMLLSTVVACNDGGKDPVDPDQPGGTPDTPDNGKEEEADPNKKNFDVTFYVYDPADSSKILYKKSRTVGRGKNATLPNGAAIEGALDPQQAAAFSNYVVDGWDSDGDGKADEGYKKVTKDLTIVAILREKATYTVSYYAEDGKTKVGSLSVKENGEITAEMELTVVAPVKMGYAFEAWVANDDTMISKAFVTGDCSFKATYLACDGTIPLVDKNLIQVDGAKDAAYANAAILAVDSSRQADGAAYDDPEKPGIAGRVQSDIEGVGYLLWDGDWIYCLVEVADSTLGGRSQAYLKLVPNAFLNDNIELFYTFSQTHVARNQIKVGIDAMGVDKYTNKQLKDATIGDMARSTHFLEILAGAQSAIGTSGKYGHDVGEGLSTETSKGFGTEGVYSYRVEVAIPAKGEGVADVERAKAEGYELDPTTGFIIGREVDGERTNNIDDYMFTDGLKLIPGNVVKFSLQLNDLQLSQNDLADKTNGCHEDADLDATADHTYKSYLYDQSGAEVYPPFSAVAYTQYDPAKYIAFSLGDATVTVGESKIWDFNAEGKPVDKDGNIVERAGE